MVRHLLGDSDVEALGDLVDEPQHVIVGPAHLVEIIGLLQHLRQPLTAEMSVSVAPSLHSGGKQRVTKPNLYSQYRTR